MKKLKVKKLEKATKLIKGQQILKHPFCSTWNEIQMYGGFFIGRNEHPDVILNLKNMSDHYTKMFSNIREEQDLIYVLNSDGNWSSNYKKIWNKIISIMRKYSKFCLYFDLDYDGYFLYLRIVNCDDKTIWSTDLLKYHNHRHEWHHWNAMKLCLKQLEREVEKAFPANCRYRKKRRGRPY